MSVTDPAARLDSLAAPPPDTRSVAVVMPIPNDPDWTIFEELSEDIPIIVVDDSDGNLAPAPRGNVRYFDYKAQKEVMGASWDAIPHRSAATRNFGHYLAYAEGFDVIVALDYDCRTRTDWLAGHLGALGPVDGAVALRAPWINTVTCEGFYARGFPYEFRDSELTAPERSTASGIVKMNMGVWDNILDLNGIDKLHRKPPPDPGLHADGPVVALGNVPVCGMNTAFARELTPAYFFLPDLWVNGSWQLSRHDDIWGGYIVKRLMDLRGDLFAFGPPIVEHTRQTPLERVVVMEHWMHLMSVPFYELVDAAVGRVAADDYREMFGAFVEAYLGEVARSSVPRHYREIFEQLGDWMSRWVRAFSDV